LEEIPPLKFTGNSSQGFHPLPGIVTIVIKAEQLGVKIISEADFREMIFFNGLNVIFD